MNHVDSDIYHETNIYQSFKHYPPSGAIRKYQNVFLIEMDFLRVKEIYELFTRGLEKKGLIWVKNSKPLEGTSIVTTDCIYLILS